MQEIKLSTEEIKEIEGDLDPEGHNKSFSEGSSEDDNEHGQRTVFDNTNLHSNIDQENKIELKNLTKQEREIKEEEKAQIINETHDNDILIDEVNAEIKKQNEELTRRQPVVNPNADISYILNKFESPKKRVKKEKERPTMYFIVNL
jgi:hypothetical protein